MIQQPSLHAHYHRGFGSYSSTGVSVCVKSISYLITSQSCHERTHTCFMPCLVQAIPRISLSFSLNEFLKFSLSSLLGLFLLSLFQVCNLIQWVVVCLLLRGYVFTSASTNSILSLWSVKSNSVFECVANSLRDSKCVCVCVCVFGVTALQGLQVHGVMLETGLWIWVWVSDNKTQTVYFSLWVRNWTIRVIEFTCWYKSFY